MSREIKKSLVVVVTLLFLVSAACAIPISTIAEPTQAAASPTSVELPDLATSSPTARIAPTETRQTANTAQPTGISPAETPIPSDGISPENAPNLVASDPLDLPEWPERLIWLNASVNLPGNPSPRPKLLTKSSANLYPVVDNPLGIGSPIPLPLNGNRIMAFAPGGASLVVQEPGQTGLYTIDGKQLWIINKPQQPYGVEYSGDGRFLAATSTEKMAVTLFDTASGNEIKELSGFETAAPVYSVIIAPGGKTIAWFARATLQFQDVETGQLGHQINFEDFIGSILFAPDGQGLALFAAGKLLIYNPQTGEKIAEETLSEPLRDLDYSPDGNLLVGIYGQSLQFWDGKSLAPITSIPVSTPLSQLSFSPDGHQIVTVSDDQKLVFWRLP